MLDKQKSCSLAFISAAMVLMLLSNACAAPFAYITNQVTNSVSVIDTATNNVTDTVNGLSQPIGVAVTPDGTQAYVANCASNSVSAINTATNKVTSDVLVGKSPYGVAVTPDGNKGICNKLGQQ